VPDLSGQATLAIIEEICSFGPRWMGSEGAAKARDFILDQFRINGLTPSLQPFKYLSYTPGQTVLLVEGHKLACEPIALSRSTAASVNAPLVFAGQCTPKELEELEATGVDLKSAIVVSENLRSFVAYPEAERVGALGFISLTNLPGNIIRCGCARLDRKVGTIPAVAIGGDDGRRLLQEVRSGRSLEATLEAKGLMEEKIGHNVVGRKAGNSPKKVLITAHYDSFWNGVHAMDNAAGTATVVALSRVLAGLSEPTLEFIIFAGEELGCWGSYSYVEENQDSLNDIRAVVNLDTFGSKLSELEIGITRDLIDLSKETVDINGVQVDCWNSPPRAASDHHPFAERGVPAIWLANCGADQRYHTPLDVPEEMSPQKLEQAATLVRELVLRLAAGH